LELVRKPERFWWNKFIHGQLINLGEISSDLHHMNINACGKVCHNGKELLSNFSPKHTTEVRSLFPE
jgi:hypothetical protein